jgi:hypothetical protein
VKLFGAALKKAGRKRVEGGENFFHLLHVCGSVVGRVLKVLGVGVAVEVGLHGVEK